MLPHRRLAVGVVLSLALVACGPPSLDDYADTLAEEAAAGGLGLTQDEAQCYGRRVADALGLERLTEIDEAGDDSTTVALTAEDADVMAEALVGCVDGVVERLFSNVGREISAEGQACLAEDLSDGDVAVAAAATLRGGELPPETRDRFDAAFVRCAGVEIVALGAPGLAFALGQDGLQITEPEARCALEHLVAELGIEKLTSAEGATLDLEGTRSLLVGLRDCTDDLLGQVREQVLDDVAASAGDDFGDEQRQCLADALDQDLLLEVFTYELVGEPAPEPTTALLEDRIAACA